ncbi:hypothetical protein PV327_002823 [Microctonus hyperodae]|uniref:Regulation of nuclear pre-mRNA domain-containing protein 2 n=1 Tax=Microctonus hyperodae TaxID=165561 RepID=A0AA39KPM6_MICHY|nr:hypothetical protein PV327_002823 [Microctonus hyperodae]
MASPDFDGEFFEKRLQALKDSQESIQSLSSWCLERRTHHKKIVATWLQVLKKVKVEHRLTLFYLANDVIQYSKRKNFEFVESWGTTLQRATTMVRDEKVKHRILRIFKIWDQRQVYDEEFLADLSGLISAAPKKKAEPQPITVPEEFQASLLISTMRSCATLEQATDARLRDLRDSNIDIDNADELCASLKDRRRVEDAEKEVEIAVKSVENYVRALEAEIRERTQVLDLLEQADQFYETQRGEVKIVTNAYRNFGSRVKNLKKKLDELLPTLTSPIPSPDVNAPSPSPDSDIELPGEDQNPSAAIVIAPPSMYGSYGQDYEPMPVPAPDLNQGNSSTDFTSNFTSFMGGNVDFDMRNIFNDRSATPTGSNHSYNTPSEAMPIEVINMRPPKTDLGKDFVATNFLKSVLPSSDGAPNPIGIPGLGLDLPEPRTESPQCPDYTHLSSSQLNITPTTPRMIGAQGATLGLNNHQLGHSTPLSIARNLASESHTPSPYSSQGSQSNVTMSFDQPTSGSINPLPPPPLPPPIFLDDENCYNKLPPKFPTWTPANEGAKEQSEWNDDGKNMNEWVNDNGDKGKGQWIEGTERWESVNDSSWSNGMRGKGRILSETPESPPMYEKTSFREPVQYNDPQTQAPILSSAADVDHRVIPLPMPSDGHLPHRLMKAADVDHRNLISLTGSPANSVANTNELTTTQTNSRLWGNTDTDYRRQVQPGDIVESVDMEMSDDETDGSKQKNRVLVDVRTQDRDMRSIMPSSQQQIPPHRMDMDMRMIPLPNNTLGHGQMSQDIHGVHSGPLPPPVQFHHNQDFNPVQVPDFCRGNADDFGTNQLNYQQNLPPGFMPNQQPDFQPDFPPHQDFHPSRQEMYEFHENQHRIVGQEFHDDATLHARYSLPPPLDHVHQHHRDPSMFHRGGRGRGGFPRNRRDRFSDDHNSPQRNMINNRRVRQEQQSENADMSNNRTVLLQSTESVVALDDSGGVVSAIPDNTDTRKIQSLTDDNVDEQLQDDDLRPPGHSSPVIETDIPGVDCATEVSTGDVEEIASEDRSQEGSVARADEPPRNLSEHFEALMNSGKTAGGNELKRQSSNGNLSEQQDEDPTTPVKKRTLLNNGPQLTNANGPHGAATELQSMAVHDYESQHGSPNFRPRLPTPVSSTTGSPFGHWRGSSHSQRSRGGFRGSPRAPWIDRGPRGPPGVGNFVPRGLKRGSPFRGGSGGGTSSFRGRGRGAGNW